MESSYVVLLMVRGHIPQEDAFVLRYFFSVIRWVKFDKFNFTVYSEGSEYSLLVSALAPYAILCLGTL